MRTITRWTKTLVMGAALAVGGCQDDNNRLATLDQETAAAQSTSAAQAAQLATDEMRLTTEAAARQKAMDALSSSMQASVAQEAARAKAAELAELQSRTDGDGQVLQAAKAYTDKAMHPTETHLKNLTTGKILGKQRGTYATAETIGGEDVDLDWVTILYRGWDKPGCAAGGGKVYARPLQGNPPPPSLLASARYISLGRTLMQLDSERVPYMAASYEEDFTGTCQNISFNTNGYPVVETSPKAGATDSGLPIQGLRGRELRTLEVATH